MTENEKTATLPSDVSDFLGTGNGTGGIGDNTIRPPSFAEGTDDFDERTKKERQARFKASADMLFSTDVSKLDDAGASALYQSVTEGMFGLPDEDGTVAFGKRAAKDPRQNIDMLRKFVKGDYALIEDPEYTKWRQMDDEAKFRYALENETTGNMVKSKLKGERGTTPMGVMAAGDMSSFAIPWTDEQRKGQEVDREWREEAFRNADYDTMDEDKKAAYRADVIADYDKKLSRRQTLATFLQFAHGLSDRAGYLLAKSFSDGTPDAANIEGLPEDERDRVYSAFSLMRGDQKKGRILGIETDFEDGTAMNRLQLGLYGFQQSVVGLVTDTGEMARDAAMWTYAKCAMDEAERKEFFKGWDAIARAEQAMEQNLPEADSIFGEAFQGLAENAHWFIPYSMIGKGGKLAKGARATVARAKLQKEVAEGGLTLAQAAAEASRARWLADVEGAVKAGKGAKKVSEFASAVAMRRQLAAVDQYTAALREIPNVVKAAKWKDAAGAGMWAAGEASAFSAFASEYIANADAAGISREESVLTAAAIGLVNAKIERLYVPGLESSLAPAQVKSLTFAAMAQAIKTDGAAGFRKWLANRVSKGVTEGAKVTLTEGAVEEPLQQMAIEHGKAFDKLCQELRKDGNATLANEAKALWDSFAATLPNDYATFIDTAADMVPSSLGFGVTTVGNMTRRQHIHNAMTRHANRRAGATAEDTMLSLDQRGEDPSKAFDYDAGLVDVIQQAVNVRTAVERHWQGEEDGGEAENPHRFEEAITAARRAWRDPQTGDAVQEIADAAGVDVKTAEVMAQYLQTEAEATAFSPQARAWTSLNMSLADIDEATIKTVLPGYVDGSFASDPENGIYSGRVRMDDGTEKTIAYRVGDFSDELRAEADENAKIGSAFGDSFNERHEELGDGIRWEMLSDAQRYQEALFASNAARMGSGVFELTDSKGQKVRVNADSVIRLANGHIADIGYGPAATQATVRHETFHSLWQFVRGTLDDADVQQLAKTLGIDVTADNWERKLDERMAHEMERYASGHYVSHAVSSRFDKMLDSWAGKIINFFGQFGPSDEVTDPKTGKPYQLKGLYDSILRGELGSGTLGVELRKVPQQTAEPTATPKSSMPVKVTDADRAEAEAKAQEEAAKEEPPAPAAPTSPAPAVTTSTVPVATSESPADASTPNQRYYRVGLPNSNVKLVGRLEVRDVDTGIITSTDADYHDRGNQNRDDKSEESRALVEKIGANPDPLQIGTVQPIASNGIVWALPNGDVIIGNHRVNGVRLGYAKGTTAELEKFVREDAAKRGIEIGDEVKKPLMVFVLERIESPDGKADVHEVVRLANESQNRGFNVREQASNDAKILIDNNLLPRMAFRADGRIDETKSGDAIGKFRQESGAQGLIAEDGSLTEEGQTRIQNAALAVLLGGEGNNALLNKIMSNAGRLDMQSELRALMKMTPELMALAEAKPAYDLRGPLAEALQLFTEWRDKDETARVEKGKTRHDWRETAKDGTRKRGLSWEMFRSQVDMFRTPSKEAMILGDLFAKAEQLRSFDREDVESEAGKKRVIDLVSGYLTDYIENARAVNTETEDMFGSAPATRAEVMAAQRGKGGEGGAARFSVEVGDDLSDVGRFADFKMALSQAQPIPDGVSLLPHDVAPKDALAYYDEHILGKTFTFPDGSTITMNPGHFFRLTCEGRQNKDGIRKGHVDGYADSASALEGIRKGEVAADRIYGWQSDRAGVMPLFGDLVEHPMFILQDKNTPEKTQNIKRYDLGDGRSIVAIFRVIDDGRRIISFHGFEPRHSRIKQYRVAYADDAIRAGTSPATPESGQAAQVPHSIPHNGRAAQGGNARFSVAQIDTPQFKSWFGDWEKDPANASKVVDEDGRPLVVWHGTDDSFTEFKPEEMRAREGSFFFAENREDAASYSGSGNVMPVYVNLRNPFDYEHGEVPDAYKERWRKATDKREQVAILKELGYDGWLADFQNGNGWGEISAFYPNQIKSATANTGAFNPRNPDIRYSVSKELTDAMRKREIMQGIPVEGAVQPWPADFPKVMIQTTLASIKQKWPELHEKAKAGSDGAAINLVRNILGEEPTAKKKNPKWEKLRALAAAHPQAIVVPVHAEEATGRNKIPAAYAYMINKIAGLRFTDGIVQTVRARHTGANAVERMTRVAAFDGPVRRGAEYILVDDHVTQGGTLNELRKYIQSHGGKVVAVSTLTASQFSDTIAISSDAMQALYAKFGNNLDEELKQAGIANGVAELTQSQARELRKLRADTLRDRLAAARLARDNEALLRNVRGRLLEGGSVLSGATDLLPGLKDYLKPDGTSTETGTRWAKAKQFQRPIGRELNSLIDEALNAGDLPTEETAALLDQLISSAEATDEIRNGVLPNFRSDSALDDPSLFPIGEDGKPHPTPERKAAWDHIYEVLMADTITGENNEALETRRDGTAKEQEIIVRANEGRPDLPPISLRNPSYETAKEFRIDIIVGPPAAGKSSVFANALSVFYRSRVLDCDAVKKMLPGFNDGNGANYVHAESSMLNKRMIFDIQHRAEDDPKRGENVVLPVLGDDAEGLRKKIADWHADGYTVYLHNNRVPILHAFGRALLRTLATGRWINPKVIRDCQDNPTRAYNLLKKEADYYDQFSNDVTLGESPIWEDGNYLDPAYGRSQVVRRAGGEGYTGTVRQAGASDLRSADSRGVDGRLERNGVKPASVGGQQMLPGMEAPVLFSVEAPRSKLVYPQLRGMSDDELLSAAVAARIALGKSDKVSDRSVKVTTVQKYMRSLHPDWDTTKIGVESQRVMSGAQKLARRIRDDIERGVSDSLVLEHLPDAMREQFGREMRQEAREGARLGAFGARANTALEERQAQIVEDAVRVQTGLDSGAIENAYGINLSETIMHLAENPLTEKPPAGSPSEAGVESADGQAELGQEEPSAEIDAKVKAVVDDIVSASGQQTGVDEQNRKNRKAAAGRDAENEAAMGEGEEGAEGEGDFSGEGAEGDALAEAVKKSALDLENPRHLARFVAELARRQWIKEHGLAKDADVWRDLVAVQFLRKTAQSVYSKLCRDLVYSRSRETAMQRIARLDAVPTVAGLLSEMEFVGALINAQRIRDTQKAMCEKLDLFLRKNFGAQGRFKPDKEEGKRKVSAEAELRARYMRLAMWLTPDAAAEEARQLQETLDALSVDFKDAGRDRDQSREFVETIRKLNVLREFGALRYKPVGEIEAAVQWWQDFARGESDDIVREMSDRDIRTKKAAHLLAVAFADPARTTIREGGKADALNRFITGHMGFISLLQDCMRHASDADAAAVKDIVDYIAREVQKAGDRSEAEKRRHNDAFHSAVESIYGKGFNDVMKDMMAPDERFTKYMGVVGGKRVTPTKGRALQLLVSLLQEGRKVQVEDEENPGQTKTVWEGGYHDNIVKHHRKGQAAKIMRLLDPADMNMLKWLGQWYENNRSDLSGVCHSLFGIGVYAELPNYFPVKMMLETQGLEKGQGVGWTIFPKALTPRVRNERDFDTSADIFSMWASRMEEAAQWKHHAQLGLEMRGIFGRAELREAVRANHGASVDDLMQGFITDILAGHGAYDRSTAGVQYFSDQIRGWTALCALGGNIGVMAKQTTSIPAFGFEIGLVNTAKYMVSAFTPEGMAAMGKIWDSEQRRTRWNLGSSEAVRNALSQQNAGWLKRMLQKSMITTKAGDVVPALVVGQGIYRDCLDRGMSEDDAMAETWSIIERTQQSGRMENQTSIQRRNKLGRIMFQFLSTQQQYLQYEMRAIREVIARPDSVKRWSGLGRAILLNHFILSSAYYWMGQLYKYALGQEPPEDELKDWIVTCLLGPYGSLFVAGFCCKYTLELAIKGYSIKGGSSMLPMESWLKNQVNDGAKLLEAIFDSDGDTWDNMLDAAVRWMSDSNSVVRDLRKIYRYRVKGEKQKK